MADLDPNLSTSLSLEQRRDQRRENRRRGAGSARQIDTSVKSPCISVCQVKDDMCTGCKRTIDEIRDWMIMTADEKRAVMTLVENRP